MPVECYGATRPRDGRQPAQNQDAFLIVREPMVSAAVCDGDGNAQQAARRVTSLVETQLRELTLGQMLGGDPWHDWVRLLDSALFEAAESTLVGLSIVGAEARGIAVGDSRVYLFPADGGCVLLTEDAPKARLGSGEAVGLPIRQHLAHRDVLVLLSDGAWTPLSPWRLDRTVRSSALGHFSDVPQLILDLAAEHGRSDDMTAVTVRFLAHAVGR